MLTDGPANSRRRELHFGGRVVWCFRDRMRSVYGVLRNAVQQHGDRTALMFGERAWTYSQVEVEAVSYTHLTLPTILRV